MIVLIIIVGNDTSGSLGDFCGPRGVMSRGVRICDAASKAWESVFTQCYTSDSPWLLQYIANR